MTVSDRQEIPDRDHRWALPGPGFEAACRPSRWPISPGVQRFGAPRRSMMDGIGGGGAV